MKKGEINFDFQALIGAINNISQALNYMKLKAGDKKYCSLCLWFSCAETRVPEKFLHIFFAERKAQKRVVPLKKNVIARPGLLAEREMT